MISKQREKAEKQKQRSEEVDEDEDGDIEGIDIEQEEWINYIYKFFVNTIYLSFWHFAFCVYCLTHIK